VKRERVEDYDIIDTTCYQTVVITEFMGFPNVDYPGVCSKPITLMRVQLRIIGLPQLKHIFTLP